ncbi:hypothetical protein B0A50_07957 [Salinomyces thailandicus]|uniref:LITAF domain-containing protein n=1 Tax=Salinomyces thailandicus TaxID=706561 RepID=A0A4U0TL99_9PEZI|nr:hypothetical protein B0A50_07957 [Salinomyces thailandica]
MATASNHQPATFGIEQSTQALQDPQVPENDAQSTTANGPPSYAEAGRDKTLSTNPAQQAYPMQQPMSHTAAPVTALHHLGETEAWIDCPFCHQRTRTRVQKNDSSMTLPYNGQIEVLSDYGPATVQSRYAAASDMESGGARLQKPPPTH